MKFLKVLLILSSVLFYSSVYATAAKYESRYTSLVAKECVILHEEGDSIIQECSGFGGYQLQASESDLRQSITLIKNGREFPLQFWDTVSPAFSTLGSKAEWRFIQKRSKPTPIALIVRLNAVTGEEANKTISWLVVSKLTDQNSCVIGKIPPQKDGTQNQKARDMADASENSPCLK